MNILVVEDAPHVRRFLIEGLEREGHTVIGADDLAKARELVGENHFDMIIIDRMLPDGDGVDLIRELRRANNRVPAIGLTGKDRIEERVEGLRSGLDDYITKPFSFEEVVARVDALAEREGLTKDLVVGPVRRNVARHQVEVNGEMVNLSAREFSLLTVLAREKGKVISRNQLLDQVWDVRHDTQTNVVDVYISYLRTKLGKGLIHTVRGKGYVLDPNR